jgi:hypothetical protein
MSDDFDELARTAADALVSAMATDSWEAVKRRFAALAVHERRMDATRTALAAKSGPGLAQAQLAQTRVWSTRLRDMLDDDPRAAAGLRAILADLRATSAPPAAPVSQKADADHGAQAVNVSGNTGEIYVGVGKVDNRRYRIFLFPITFLVHVAKRAAAAHPVTATAATVIVIAGGVSGGVALASGTPSPLASLVGSWYGTYTCPQGPTGLHLQVAPEKAGAAPVMLNFYPVPANPSVPQGSVRFRGTLSGTTVHLTPVAWVVQPAGYVFTDFVGALPAGRDVFSGTVTGPGCTTFSLQRATSDVTPSDFVGTWVGSYTCAQGLTGLRLVIQPGTGNRLGATFNFYAVPSNPSVPSGSFAMTGFFDPAGVFLDQDHWIKQPPGYGMVNLAGNPPSTAGRTLNGSVVGCSPFSLKKGP